MPVYSHSQLSAYENCPLKYKLRYRDNIKRDTEGIEAFMGSRVHDVLQKCYNDARLCKTDTLEDLLGCFEAVWEKNWYDGITICHKDYGAENYRETGRKMVAGYFNRHAPFDGDTTLGTEVMVRFALGEGGRYRMRGYIDRLSRSPDGSYYINDYKTSGHLPTQQDADGDRQLALYQIGIQQMWPDIQDVLLIWHYLAFDQALTSQRSPEQLDELASSTSSLIEEIEAAEGVCTLRLVRVPRPVPQPETPVHGGIFAGERVPQRAGRHYRQQVRRAEGKGEGDR